MFCRFAKSWFVNSLFSQAWILCFGILPNQGFAKSSFCEFTVLPNPVLQNPCFLILVFTRGNLALPNYPRDRHRRSQVSGFMRGNPALPNAHALVVFSTAQKTAAFSGYALAAGACTFAVKTWVFS
jgi:hypothetical protein